MGCCFRLKLGFDGDFLLAYPVTCTWGKRINILSNEKLLGYRFLRRV
jgi:hypothetical protein